MTQGQYPNSGSLFRKEERKSENDAHYSGSAEVDGVQYFVDGWINSPPGKKSYMRLKFKPKVARTEAAPAKQMTLAQELDDDIPF